MSAISWLIPRTIHLESIPAVKLSRHSGLPNVLVLYSNEVYCYVIQNLHHSPMSAIRYCTLHTTHQSDQNSRQSSAIYIFKRGYILLSCKSSKCLVTVTHHLELVGNVTVLDKVNTDILPLGNNISSIFFSRYVISHTIFVCISRSSIY